MVEQLYKLKLYHNDIKTPNILIEQKNANDFQIYLIDLDTMAF